MSDGTCESLNEVIPRVRFDLKVRVYETYSKRDYDRRTESTIPITPVMAMLIRRELDILKTEMEIHNDSRQNTRFHLINKIEI